MRLLLTDNLVKTEPYATDHNSQWKIVDTECCLRLGFMTSNSFESDWIEMTGDVIGANAEWIKKHEL
jgi:hypothetical protein